MTITVKQAVEAYGAIQRISHATLPFMTARELRKLRDKLKTEYEIVAEEEKKLIEKYAGAVEGNGVKFKTKEDKENFEMERDTIYNQTIDIDAEQINLVCEALSLTLADMDALEPVAKLD